MNESPIEWTDLSWNPVSGCSKVSQGCKNCYAERLFPRTYPGRHFTELKTHPDRLYQPMRIRKPQRIFVNSMSDLFHEDVADSFIDRVFAVMALCPQHTFQILTKRPRRMLEYVGGGGRASEVFDYVRNSELGYMGNGDSLPPQSWPIKNIWLGVSAEDQRTFDERVSLLAETPAAVHFASLEPLLDEIDMGNALDDPPDGSPFGRLDWVIAGGESGPNARPSHPDWFRYLRDSCAAADVPFFFKQWGEWAPGEIAGPYGKFETRCWFNNEWKRASDDWIDEVDHGPLVYRVGKKAAGRLLDGREHSEFPV